LKRVVQHRIENAIASGILGGTFQDGDTVRVDYQGKTFTFTNDSKRKPHSV
jgi:ATP-dependent Clp protease ATP-binding subunit ClpA